MPGLGLGLWPTVLGGGGGPAWPLSAGGVRPNLDIDFLNDMAYVGGAETTIAAAITHTRTSTAYYRNRAGLLTSVASGTLRYGDMGALIEGARTNVVLHNRDLTNAAWTKSNCTAAKDQIGPDGVANSASSLTATAGNATCLQAITLASSARLQSAFIKRLTGSGVIEMTTDNGTTWVAILPRAYWDQLYIPTQTLANPTVGFRIVTSGDAIAVDFVQNENGICPTSPIATTTVAVTRAADLLRPVNKAYINQTGMTFYCSGALSGALNADPAALFQVSHADGYQFFNRRTTATAVVFGQSVGSVGQWNESISFPIGQAIRSPVAEVLAVAPNDIACVNEGGALVTDATAIVSPFDNVAIGSQGTSNHWNGYITRFAAWGSRVSNVNMASVMRQKCDLVVISEGDSIPLTPTVRDFVGFPGYAQYLSSRKWRFDNRAVSGSTVVNGVDAASLSGTRLTTLLALRTAFSTANPDAPVITLIHCGHNDLAGNGHDAAAYTTQLATYLDTLKAAGHTTLVCTVPPSTSNVAFNPAKTTANTTIRGWLGTRVDYLCDWDNTVMGLDASAADTTLYSDGIHPTTLGAIIFGEYLKTVLDAIAA